MGGEGAGSGGRPGPGTPGGRERSCEAGGGLSPARRQAGVRPRGARAGLRSRVWGQAAPLPGPTKSCREWSAAVVLEVRARVGQVGGGGRDAGPKAGGRGFSHCVQLAWLHLYKLVVSQVYVKWKNDETSHCIWSFSSLD